jgi:hypothetical protein
MNRRSFLAVLAAPLIAQPTLEEIERLAWRRRLYPAWPAPPRQLLGPRYVPYTLGSIEAGVWVGTVRTLQRELNRLHSIKIEAFVRS